jgi:hypothetical protein
MAAYIVACGLLLNPIQSERLASRLAAYGEFRQINSGMWLVQTDEEALDILPDLVACLGTEHALFVARLQGDAAWEGYSRPLGSWMTDAMLNTYDYGESETDTMALALATLAARPVRLNS